MNQPGAPMGERSALHSADEAWSNSTSGVESDSTAARQMPPDPSPPLVAATGVAVVAGLLVAMVPGANGPGSGGLILWPLFGAVNQLLAGLAFMVVAFFLKKNERPLFFMVPPAILMLIMPAWAMIWRMFNGTSGWLATGNYLLLTFGFVILLLQALMVWEGVRMLKRAAPKSEST